MASILGKKERIIWISIVIVMVVTTIFVVSKYQTTLNMFNQKASELKAEQTKSNILNQEVSGLKSEKTTWLQKEGTLNVQVEALNAQVKALNENVEDITRKFIVTSSVVNRFSFDRPSLISKLKELGFDGGVEGIANDLIKHPELIP